MARKLTEELFPDIKARQDNTRQKDIAPKQTPDMDDKAKADAIVASDANGTGWHKQEPDKEGVFKDLSWENLKKGDKVKTLYRNREYPDRLEDGIPAQDQIEGNRWVTEGEVKNPNEYGRNKADKYGGIVVDSKDIKRTGKWKSLID